jgi:membrane fusion protein (multidrug efflux system)
MKQVRRVVIVVVAFLWVVTEGYGKGAMAGQPNDDQGAKLPMKGQTDADPVACVKTAPITEGVLTEWIVVYGSIIPAPGALQTLSKPYQSQVLGTMVSDGQKVAKGDPLLRLQPGPDTLLKLEQARNDFQLQEASYKEMKHRFDLRLATNEQLLASKQTMEQARLSLQSLTRMGIDGETEITASVAGLVKKVYAQEGALVPPGSPLVDIVAQNRVEVRLGVEPEDIDRVKSGQTVSLNPVNAPDSPEVNGQIREISYAVNPSTRLIDVFVTLTAPEGFLLGEFITGRIPIKSDKGLIVPRSAVLPEGDKHVLFTVKGGRSMKHVVRIGLENAEAYQVMGTDLRAGQQVVIEGNYELSDGMDVTTGACK